MGGTRPAAKAYRGVRRGRGWAARARIARCIAAPAYLRGTEPSNSFRSSSFHRTPAPRNTESIFLLWFRKSSHPAVAKIDGEKYHRPPIFVCAV
jgi:hypothetical protein